jgi:UDP-glucuronate decarboxylase
MHRPIFDRKNILVTGGAGFIGSHLCDELVRQNKVICLDNFSTGREENINHLLQNPNFEFVRHDLTQPIDLEAEPSLKAFQVQFQGIQEIYHLASPTSPKAFLEHPIETLMTNADATRNSLDLAVKYESSYLFVSSDAVYGEPMEDTPYPENYWGYVDPIGRRSPYAEGKRFAESLVVHYRERHALKAKIARVFNCYGPRLWLDDGRMIPDLIVQALKNEPLNIFGAKDGQTTFCYVSDLIEGLVRLMKSTELGPINLGSPDVLKIEDVAKTILQLTESSSSIQYSESNDRAVHQGSPNIRLAKERLGWFPVVALAEGLRRTVDYFKGAKSIELTSLSVTSKKNNA